MEEGLTYEHTRRADELAARPDVQAWIKNLKQLAQSTPEGVWLYVASGTVCVMACDETGHGYYRKDDGVIQESTIDEVAPNGVWDGGDW